MNTNAATTDTSTNISNAAKLEQNTIRYWIMSRCWNGKNPFAGPAPTIEQAIDTSNDILRFTGPKRLLAKKVASLKHEIICHVSPEDEVDSNSTAS